MKDLEYNCWIVIPDALEGLFPWLMPPIREPIPAKKCAQRLEKKTFYVVSVYDTEEKKTKRNFDNPFPDGVDAVDTSDIEAMPAADVVEVVRCRDCEYHGYNNENEMYCYHCFGFDDVEPYYYCCHGERKE